MVDRFCHFVDVESKQLNLLASIFFHFINKKEFIVFREIFIGVIGAVATASIIAILSSLNSGWVISLLGGVTKEEFLDLASTVDNIGARTQNISRKNGHTIIEMNSHRQAVFQLDGNFVVKDPRNSDTALFQSKTAP